NPRGQPLHATARHRVKASINQVHGPIISWSLMHADMARAQGDSQVSEEPLVLEEVALDHVAAVSERNEKLGKALPRIRLHDVPENGAATDLDHRLRLGLGLF